jgi:hypothetical protein
MILDRNKGKNDNNDSLRSSSGNSDAGGDLIASAVVGGASLIGLIFKGIWKLMYWTFKGIFLGFKAIFYTFPKYLWSKGTYGKIGCGVYIFLWCVSIFAQRMGKDYVFRNWYYLLLILIAIIASAATTITFRIMDKQFAKRAYIALSSGIFVVLATSIIGLFLTKDLIQREEEKKPTKIESSIDSSENEIKDE